MNFLTKLVQPVILLSFSLAIPLLGVGCITVEKNIANRNLSISNTTFPTPLLAEETSTGIKLYYLDYADGKKRVDLDFHPSLPNGYTIQLLDRFFAYDRTSGIILFVAEKGEKLTLWKYDRAIKSTLPFCIDGICEFSKNEKYAAIHIEAIKSGRAVISFYGINEFKGKQLSFYSIDIATQKESDGITVGSHGGAIGGIDSNGQYFEWPINGKTHYGYIETYSNTYSKDEDKPFRSFRIFLYDQETGQRIFKMWRDEEPDFTWEKYSEVMKTALDKSSFIGEVMLEEVPDTLRRIAQRKDVLFDEIWAVGDHTLAFELYKGTLLIDLENKTATYQAKTHPRQTTGARFIGQTGGNHIWEQCPNDKLFDIWDLRLPMQCLE